jgi:hypothetical protein
MSKKYKNNFGELNENSITLILDNREQIIDLKNLVKIRFVKRQKYHINYMAFLLSIYLMVFLKNHTLSPFVQLLISLIVSLLLVAGFFFKTFQYRFVLIRKNFFEEIIVSKQMCKDAENLAFQINNNVNN